MIFNAATAKFDEGIETCIFVLSQLGIDVPTEINLNVYQTEVYQVKQLVAGKSENDILSLPMLLEKQKLVRDLQWKGYHYVFFVVIQQALNIMTLFLQAAMQFLNHLLSMTFIAKVS